MRVDRREFLKTVGISVVGVSDLSKLEKIAAYLSTDYTQQPEQSLYTVQRYNFNNFKSAEEPEIPKILTTQGIASDEFLQSFTGVNSGNADYLIGNVIDGGNKFYENRTNSLEGRVNAYDNIKNLINAEPVMVKAFGIKENGEDYIIVFDDRRRIYAVDSAINEYVGDVTQKFINLFGFVPLDALSARVNNHPSPYHDNVLALKKPFSNWSLYWWEDVIASMDKKEVAKPIPTLENFDLEGMFYNEDKTLGNVISLGRANLDGKKYDSLYAIRTPPLEGRIDDLQAARDIMEFNQEPLGRGVIARWGQSIPVFVDLSASRELVAKAIKKLESKYGLSYVIINEDILPRILDKADARLIELDISGLSEITGLYKNSRIKSVDALINPNYAFKDTPWLDNCTCDTYSHELEHATGLWGNTNDEHIPDDYENPNNAQRKINFFKTLYSLPHGTRVYDDGTWRVILNPDGTNRATQYSQSTARVNQKNSLQQFVSALRQSYPTSKRSYYSRDFLRG